MAYNVSVSSGRMYFTNSETGSYRSLANPAFQLDGDDSKTAFITVIDDGGKWERKFKFEDFGTIGISDPAVDIFEVYSNLINLLASMPIPPMLVGGSVPVTTGSSVIDNSFSTQALPYTVPAGVNSFSIITQGSVAVDGVTVASGTVISSSHPSQDGTVLSPTFTNVSGGSVFVLLGIKI